MGKQTQKQPKSFQNIQTEVCVHAAHQDQVSLFQFSLGLLLYVWKQAILYEGISFQSEDSTALL